MKRSTHQVLELAHAAGELKRLRRTGWVRSGLQDPESVAEHCFRVAVLACAYLDHPGVRPGRLLKMALVHDLAEALVGDIVSNDGARTLPNHSEKEAAERAAMARLERRTGDDELVALFDDMTAGDSPEAHLIRQLDGLEMAIQAFEYEQATGHRLDRFYASARKRIRDDDLRAVLDELLRRRPRARERSKC